MDKEPKFKIDAGKAADTAAGTVVGAIGLAAKIVVTVLLVLLTTVLLLGCVFAFYVKTCLTEDLNVSLSDYQLSESSIIYCETAPGEYQELATLHGSENRIWVDLEDIPDYLVKALVAIEDHRFYEHKGVDWYRTVGAMYTMLTGGDSSFGGSTLTQQLIKTLTGNNEVTVQRKLIEIFQALEFEKKYDKDDILVWYLNAVYFGEGCDGIYTAAEKYFGKEPSELTLAESASIVGIVNLPTYYSPFYSEENNKKRQETVLRRMYELGYISYEEYEQAKNEELVFIRSEEGTGDEDIYSYYVEAVRKEVIADLMEQKGVSQETAAMLVSSGGYRIYACLDPYIQECIDNVYLDVENFPKPSNNTSQQFQSAIVIMDPYTGEVMGMSGGVGEKNANLIMNRATDALRAPGSSFKPLAVYAPAIEYGLITPSTLVKDGPQDEVDMSQSYWYPRNSPDRYDGIITIAEAVRQSKNTVAAQVLDKLGIDASANFLKNKLGITSLVEQDYNYAPLALGELTNGVSVLEMAQAYGSPDLYPGYGRRGQRYSGQSALHARGHEVQHSDEHHLYAQRRRDLRHRLRGQLLHHAGCGQDRYLVGQLEPLVCGLYALLRRRCLDGLRPAGVHQHLRQPRGPGLEACHAAGARWPRIQELPEPGLDRRRHEDIRRPHGGERGAGQSQSHSGAGGERKA